MLNCVTAYYLPEGRFTHVPYGTVPGIGFSFKPVLGQTNGLALKVMITVLLATLENQRLGINISAVIPPAWDPIYRQLCADRAKCDHGEFDDIHRDCVINAAAA
jgi:hypothetical protein